MAYGNSFEGNAFFVFFLVCYIVTDCSLQLRFDKKQKCCNKRIHFVTDDGMCGWKTLYKMKN